MNHSITANDHDPARVQEDELARAQADKVLKAVIIHLVLPLVAVALFVVCLQHWVWYINELPETPAWALAMMHARKWLVGLLLFWW